jgi:hypothetical protein
MRLIVGDPAKLTSAPCQRVNRVNPEFEICSWRYSGARLDRMGWVPAKDPPLVDAFRLLVCDPFAKFGDTPCWKATVCTDCRFSMDAAAGRCERSDTSKQLTILFSQRAESF